MTGFTFEPLFYVLDDDGLPKAATFLEWAEWFGPSKNRYLARTVIAGLRVSTVFIGIGWGPMFETVIFSDDNNDNDGRRRTYTTRDAAVQGHIELCFLISIDADTRPRGYSRSHWRKIFPARWVRP